MRTDRFNSQTIDVDSEEVNRMAVSDLLFSEH